MTTTPKTLTVTECHQLLDALLHRNAPHKSFRKGIRNYTMALLMLDAGLRVGEVVALEMSDLYYGGRPVENLGVRPEIAKTKTERTVPLSTRVRNALTEYYEEHPWLQTEATDHAAFVQFLHDTPITTRQVERIIRAAAMKSIGRPIHPHVLRHTFGTRIERKAGLRIAQELLGHKNVSSTQIYTHPNEDDKKKAIEQLEVPPEQPDCGYDYSPRMSDLTNDLNTVDADRDV